jgi:hypothetical protein
MNKVILIALLTTLTSGMAFAQSQGAGPGGHQQGGPQSGHGFPAAPRGNPVDRMAEALGLDDAQVAELTAIFEDTRAQHDAERAMSREVFCTIRADAEALILGVLTPAQQAEWELIQAEREQRRAEHRAEREALGEFGNGEGRRGPPPCDG